MKILVVDMGGTNLKMLASGRTEPRTAPSGPETTPSQMVETVKSLSGDWDYEAVSIGYPGLAGDVGPRSEPGNLGRGWVGFHFAAAFGRPVKIINDAAMQALGSYEGGRMLFLGLGTGLGSAMISENVVVPLELGRLSCRKGCETLGETVGKRGLEQLGEEAWRETVLELGVKLVEAFLADYLVLGGGNAARLGKDLPHGFRLGHNLTAFRGGFRLWGVDDVPVLSPDAHHHDPPPPPSEWRVV
jgi:hypothetical protein